MRAARVVLFSMLLLAAARDGSAHPSVAGAGGVSAPGSLAAPADAAAGAARFEPGLADRRRRYARPPWQRAAMLPAQALRLPFKIVNYPLEHDLIHREPGFITVYGKRVYTRLGAQGIALRLGGLGSGSGPGAGVRWELPRGLTAGRPLRLSATGTYRRYQQYAASLDSLRRGAFTGSLHLLYSDRPEEDFFGLGLASRRDDRSTYRQSETLLGWQGLIDLGRDWRLALQAAGSRSDIRRGRDDRYEIAQEVFDPRQIAGLEGRFDLLDYGFSLVYDGRDVKRYARRGSYLEVGALATDGLRHTPQAFTKYYVELQQAVPLPGDRRSLAARLRGVVTDNRAAGLGIPAFRLERLGGSRTLRGYDTYRFTDKDLLVGNVEYRFPVWNIEPPSGQALDGVLFFDYGTVLPALEKLQQQDLRSGAGFGARFVTARDLVLRADNAWTAEGYRFHLGLRGTF